MRSYAAQLGAAIAIITLGTGSAVAQSSTGQPGALTTPAVTACTSCLLEAFNPTVLSYPGSVVGFYTTIYVATVIVQPFVDEYGRTISINYTTVTHTNTEVIVQPTQSAAQTAAPSLETFSAVWSTLGTLLTWPTTYLAFSSFGLEPACTGPTSALSLPEPTASAISHLIFPQDESFTELFQNVTSYLDTLNLVNQDLSQCSFAITNGTSQNKRWIEEPDSLAIWAEKRWADEPDLLAVWKDRAIRRQAAPSGAACSSQSTITVSETVTAIISNGTPLSETGASTTNTTSTSPPSSCADVTVTMVTTISEYITNTAAASSTLYTSVTSSSSAAASSTSTEAVSTTVEATSTTAAASSSTTVYSSTVVTSLSLTTSTTTATSTTTIPTSSTAAASPSSTAAASSTTVESLTTSIIPTTSTSAAPTTSVLSQPPVSPSTAPTTSAASSSSLNFLTTVTSSTAAATSSAAITTSLAAPSTIAPSTQTATTTIESFLSTSSNLVSTTSVISVGQGSTVTTNPEATTYKTTAKFLTDRTTKPPITVRSASTSSPSAAAQSSPTKTRPNAQGTKSNGGATPQITSPGGRNTLTITTSGNPSAQLLTLQSTTITANSLGGFVLTSGTTAYAGGPAITISGTTISIGSKSSIAIINGHTQSLFWEGPPISSSAGGIPIMTHAGQKFTGVISGSEAFFLIPTSVLELAEAMASPVLTLKNDKEVTAFISNNATAFLMGTDAILTPGGQCIFEGTTWSLPNSGDQVKVNGVMSTLGGLVNGNFTVVGQTVNSTTTSTQSTTSSAGLGGAIMSGLGVTTAINSQTSSSGGMKAVDFYLHILLLGLWSSVWICWS